MICVSIANIDFEKCLDILNNEEFAEIRIDSLSFTEEQFIELFNKPLKTLATCREEGGVNPERIHLLKLAIDSGADYIDVEIEAEENYRKELVEYAKEKGCKVVISYHNFESTPDYYKLKSITETCFNMGADIAKIVTTVSNNKDRLNVISLYKTGKDNVVAFGMGEKGKLTRALSIELGAPYTYAMPDGGTAVAPGQISKSELKKQINSISEI